MVKPEPETKSRRIGVFGGTFDPIHLGHLRSAEEIRERLGLVEVIFVPAARPPHKEVSSLLDASHRLRMVELATAQNGAFSVSAIEIERPGPSYSIDTLRQISEAQGPQGELYFIVGADAFREIHTWRDVEGLLKAAHFVVTSRPGAPLSDIIHVLKKTVTTRWPSLTFQPGFDPELGLNTLKVSNSEKLIYLMDITHLDISASEIRQRAREGLSIRYLVPEAVERYIQQHGLYRETP